MRIEGETQDAVVLHVPHSLWVSARCAPLFRPHRSWMATGCVACTVDGVLATDQHAKGVARVCTAVIDLVNGSRVAKWCSSSPFSLCGIVVGRQTQFCGPNHLTTFLGVPAVWHQAGASGYLVHSQVAATFEAGKPESWLRRCGRCGYPSRGLCKECRLRDGIYSLSRGPAKVCHAISVTPYTKSSVSP